MKIAFVSDSIYPYFKGGKEKRLFEISTRLSKSGNDVHVYTMNWWGGNKIKSSDGITYHAICKRLDLYKGDKRSVKEGLFFGLSCLKLFFEEFDVIDVDHMPFFPLYGVWVATRLKDAPFFGTWNEVWGRNYWVKYMGFWGNLAYILEKFSVKLPDYITSISRQTTLGLTEILHCKKPIQEIGCGLDYGAIKKITPSEQTSDVLYAGRLVNHKRVDLLIKAVAKLIDAGKNVQCLVVGEGPERYNLEKLAKKLKVEQFVQFHNFYEQHEAIYALMKSSKVFVLPSEREGFGIVVIEANACGIPVVVSQTTGNAANYLIHDAVNGFRSPPSVNGFSKNIENALRNHKRLQRQCKSAAIALDWSNIAEQTENGYIK